MQRKRLRFLTTAAMIAALYALLTWVSALVGLAGGAVQLRLSEALCVLPCLTPAAIPGLFFGCAIANLLTGGVVWDVVFGSLATLIGALGSYFLRRHPHLSILPPIFANALILPPVIAYVTVGRLTPPLYFGIALGVGAGEILSCGVLGTLLLIPLLRYRAFLFSDAE